MDSTETLARVGTYRSGVAGLSQGKGLIDNGCDLTAISPISATLFTVREPRLLQPSITLYSPYCSTLILQGTVTPLCSTIHTPCFSPSASSLCGHDRLKLPRCAAVIRQSLHRSSPPTSSGARQHLRTKEEKKGKFISA